MQMIIDEKDYISKGDFEWLNNSLLSTRAELDQISKLLLDTINGKIPNDKLESIKEVLQLRFKE